MPCWTNYAEKPELQRTVLIFCVCVAVLLPSASFAEDTWPCEVVLCLANPRGPTALKECEPPIKRAWKAWAKGKSVPECKKKNSDGSDGGDLKDGGTYIDHESANPEDPNKCPFPYYAGPQKNRYCAFTGVTNQYIDGKLWGRIWYGGPAGQPYIEMLHEDPNNPRQPDGFEAAWALLKQRIEDKADYAAIALKIAESSEKVAAAAEAKAASARAKADEATQHAANLEASLPGLIAQYEQDYNAWTATYQEKKLAADAAKAAGTSDAGALEAEAMGAFYVMQSYQSALNDAYATRAQLPQIKAQAEQLSNEASALEADATTKRSTALHDKAVSDAATEDAKPLPAYGDSF
jgi:hypothetical protein